jgi:hypothetical protein
MKVLVQLFILLMAVPALAHGPKPACELLLAISQNKYRSVIHDLYENHKTVAAAATALPVKPGQGFGTVWLDSLKHVSEEFFKNEEEAFTVSLDLESFLAERQQNADEFAKNLNSLSFGGLNSYFARELWSVHEALVAFAETEEEAIQRSRSFKKLARRRLGNLETLRYELEHIGVYMPAAGGPSGPDFVALRDLWLSYVTKEIAIYSRVK